MRDASFKSKMEHLWLVSAPDTGLANNVQAGRNAFVSLRGILQLVIL